MNLPFQVSQRWLLYLLGFGISLLFVVTIIGERGAFHLWRLKGEKRSLDEQNYRLQKENGSLRHRISRLRKEDFYLEKLAREELNLVRPGEIIYRFPPSGSKRSHSSGLSEPLGESPPSGGQTERR